MKDVKLEDLKMLDYFDQVKVIVKGNNNQIYEVEGTLGFSNDKTLIIEGAKVVKPFKIKADIISIYKRNIIMIIRKIEK